MKFLIVGLGNIGAEYELTRHNIGFLTVDEIADRFDKVFEPNKLASTCECRHKGKSIHLIKPSTYMNLSGKAVNYWIQKLKITPQQTLILTDDIALPFGKLRMRGKGSSAGHNGLGNIEETLATNAYPRLRMGIGNDFQKGQQVDYVLSRFNEEEMKALPEILTKAGDMALSFCSIGIQRTMNFFNS